MDELNEARAAIDAVDAEICALYERRMALAGQVAVYKAAHGLPVLQPEREQAVLKQVGERIGDPALRPGAARVFETLMAVSRAYQRQNAGLTASDGAWESLITQAANRPAPDPALPVGFQGEAGSFSEAALEQAFGPDAARRHYPRFSDVFEALRRGEIGCGVLPIENSSTGGVHEVYDLMHEYDFALTGEVYVTVDQQLVGLPEARLEEIREVRSHPQGLEQSRAFLDRYPAMRPVPWLNTAAAALSVAEEGDPTVAAIASRRAAALYGLQVLAPQVNDLGGNTTRFVLVERALRLRPQDGKVSVAFSLDDRAGTLYRLLGHFFEQGVNLVRIESRPLRNSRWKYFLYVDLQGSLWDQSVAEALRGIAAQADYFRLLGSYPAGEAEA